VNNMTTTHTTNAVLQVKKQGLSERRVVPVAHAPLQAGEARLTVNKFAFTANNITYGAFGDAMQYWDFFPTGVAEWGVIPVWGFGTVTESNAAGVEVGQRFYGYFPMAQSVTVAPARVSPSGFTDSAAHRQPMAAVYNQYTNNATDPAFDKNTEPEQLVYRPLFMTSFMIDDFLDDNKFFGAKRVVLSSASSKTAYGTAYMLHQRAGIEVVGLTSPGNVAFTEKLGCYHRVVTYAQVASLDANVPTVYVDMAGNADVRLAVHTHFGESLKYSCSVGGTHWDNIGRAAGLPGPKPLLFFAPAQIKKRVGDWGGAGFHAKFATAWGGFLARVRNPASGWFQAKHHQGADAALALVQAMLDGDVRPEDGHIVSLG
jgi:hypothetical protein